MAAAVANAGTVVVGFPTGVSVGTFTGGILHVLFVAQNRYQAPKDFSASIASGGITLTNQSAGTWPAGAPFILQMNSAGDAIAPEAIPTAPATGTSGNPIPPAVLNPDTLGRTIPISERLVPLGSPTTLSTTAILATATVTAAVNLLTTPVNLVNTGAVGGRGVSIVSSNSGDTTQTVTITGTDINGQTLTQTLTLNGTSGVNSTKAFAIVSSVVVSATTTGTLSCGYTNVLGIPVPLPITGFILKEIFDGVTATAGTTVVADQTAGGATATTGDVRGTYLPNTACNGTHSYQLILAVPDLKAPGAEPQA